MARAPVPDPQPHPADEVLAEVDQGGAGRRGEHRDRGQHLGRPAPAGRPARPAGRGRRRRPRPGRVRSPARRPQVGALAVVEVVGEDAALAGGPGAVGGEHVHGAVGGGHLELGEQRQPVAVERAAAAPAEPAAEPPVAEQHLELVVALADQVGDVVGLVAQPVVVAGPARRQHVVADPAAVELGGVHAVRGGVQPRLDDPPGHVEGRAQDRRRRVQAAERARADEPGRPVARARAGRPRPSPARSSPTRSPRPAHPHADACRLPRASGAAGHGTSTCSRLRHPDDLGCRARRVTSTSYASWANATSAPGHDPGQPRGRGADAEDGARRCGARNGARWGRRRRSWPLYGRLVLCQACPWVFDTKLQSSLGSRLGTMPPVRGWR